VKAKQEISAPDTGCTRLGSSNDEKTEYCAHYFLSNAPLLLLRDLPLGITLDTRLNDLADCRLFETQTVVEYTGDPIRLLMMERPVHRP